MPRTDMILTPHPAGHDDELRRALEDLQLDRWRSSQVLLERTDTWAALTSRSQVLAAAAAKGHAIEAWCAEAPTDAYALMMQARVITHRTLAASRRGVDFHTLRSMIGNALQTCNAAERLWPHCPVPGICRLAFAELDVDRNRPIFLAHWAPPPERHLLPVGPWPLLEAVERLDPGNREAHHRMLACLMARRSGALDFARWASDRAKPGSPLHVLPLYAYVHDFAVQFKKGTGSSIGYWSTDATRHHVTRARDGWFIWHEAYNPRRTCSLLDLNHLAYGLTATGLPGAAPVFEAIGPFATPAPWKETGPQRWWESSFANAYKFAIKEASRR